MCWTSQVYHPYSRLGAHFGGGGDIGLGPAGATDNGLAERYVVTVSELPRIES